MHENPNRANEAYGWHFQYLTVIGLALSTLTFAVALLADLTLSARLFLVKNLLSICSAPMEVLISVLYWGLRMIDERLVVPDWAYIPMHAGKSSGWSLLQMYPYPIFEQVPFEGRVGLFVMSAVVMALSTATLKWLYGRVNGFGTASKPKVRPGALKQNGALKHN
ncbi:hypothetical protein KXW25_004913 [Aspergillus fumigatus]|nr:hypothetical protein KXV47_002790 [Aspergillus fumigatus]KAH2666446.1 hypothetical protein KXV32_006508 [Aspergillus fumigatus]KAH2919603.1 hypothetical protein KXW25_004913 [Aspergillus fumigatus]KAH3020473.1 hypothetical protein KXW60_005531 [Aspergillus fumigatus]KAH3204563.1 hypothetical protein KXW62_006082 [Aspergillus fumigatus]